METTKRSISVNVNDLAQRPPCGNGACGECLYVRHYDETVGLWVIDEDPQEVDVEWIRKHAYRIAVTDSDS